MRKEIKIVITIILAVLMIFMVENVVNADTGSIISALSNPGDVDGTDEIVDLGRKVVGVIQVSGAIISIAIMALLGIKYITSSLEEKADVKKAMIPYIVGAILLFSTTTIVNLVYNVITGKGETTPANPYSGTGTSTAGMPTYVPQYNNIYDGNGSFK